ncbi:tetratricopeptide repeat protein [Hyalangium gracile]|uniref:tetratricopeptide repeat protein n=1 Tax=Hyalangium gracile TaxID=394092 RepID=UPI001CCF9B21|nr:tetratricopeptide repeat protein [Hyalangium gracile]
MPLRVPAPGRADIAVLTVIPQELFAAREALNLSEKTRSKDEVGTISYRGEVSSALTGRRYDVVLICLGRAGNAVSAASVQDVILRYQPQAVLLMGIAAGLRGKVRVGEVVLSERVVAYEPAAAVRAPDGNSRQEPRPESQVIPHRMNQDVTHYRPEPERLQRRFMTLGGRFPEAGQDKESFYQEHVATRITVKTATIASGEKLLRDPARLLEVRALHGKIEVGEMEAVGLMEACQRSEVPWLVIRGISDFGDEFKDDRFHELASRTAAVVLADFIEHGLQLPERSGPSGSRRWPMLAVGALLLMGGAGLYWANGAREKNVPAALCKSSPGPSPFKRPDATHFLVAHFEGSPSADQSFSEVVSTQVMRALKTYNEEALRNPREVDLEVPEDSLEIGRLDCFIESHAQAEAVARALDADVVIWGQAFLNPSDNGYTIRPHATLYHADGSIRRGGESKIEVRSLGHLDLPALRSTEPFLLVQFAVGLHLYERGEYWLAARFFEKSAEHVVSKERGAAEIKYILGEVYLHAQALEPSLRYSKEALELERGRGSSLESALLNNLGSVLEAREDYQAALEHYQQAIAVSEKALGKDNPDMAVPLNNMGTLFFAQGKHPEALSYLRRSLEISEKALGKDHPEVAGRLNNMGGVLQAQGKYAEALTHYQRALVVSERALGKEHPHVATVLNNMGSALRAQGKDEEALEKYQRALGIVEKALGKRHHSMVPILNGIGHILMAQEEYAEALERYQQGLVISKESLGEEHPDVVIGLSNVGGALMGMGDYAKAEEICQQALILARRVLGEDHPFTQRVRANLEQVRSHQ